MGADCFSLQLGSSFGELRPTLSMKIAERWTSARTAQSLDARPQHRRRHPLPRFPLIYDGLTGRANPSSQSVLRQAHPPTQIPEAIAVVIRNGV
jgi:hypothetical protein